MAPPQGRIAGHVRLLGILWLALSAFRLLPGAILMIVTAVGLQFLPPEVPPFVHVILPIIGGVFLVIGFAGAAVGWGLLTRQDWARMAAIILGALNLPDLPFGTALGIYTLWVLLPAESEQEYRISSRAA